MHTSALDSGKLNEAEVERWLLATSKEESSKGVLLKLAEFELSYSANLVGVLFNAVAAERVRGLPPQSAAAAVVRRLAFKLISHFSQNGDIGLGNTVASQNKARELSVQIGYGAVCLSELLHRASEIRAMLNEKKHGCAAGLMAQVQLMQNQQRKQPWAVKLVAARTQSAGLLLRQAMGTAVSQDQQFRTVFESRSRCRQRMAQPQLRRFDVVSLFIATRWVEYQLRTNRHADALAFAAHCTKETCVFGPSAELHEAFRKSVDRLCLQYLPMPKQYPQVPISQQPPKFRSLSAKPSLGCKPSYSANQRKLSCADKEHPKGKLVIGKQTELFLKQKPKLLASPSPQHIYRRIAAIRKKEVSSEQLLRELEQFNEKCQYKNLPLLTQQRSNNPKQTSLLKKSKLVVKRTRANESIQQNIVHSILMRSAVQIDFRFVFFGVGGLYMVRLELQDSDELLLRICTPHLSYSHCIHREDSENNRQFVTQWPVAKYLFKRWLKKSELLKGIDRVLTPTDYDIEEEYIPFNLRRLQRAEIMEFTELRQTVKAFLQSTLYRKRHLNGWREVLNNRTNITRLPSKQSLLRAATLEQLSLEPYRIGDVLEMLGQYDLTLVEQHVILYRGDYAMLSLYIDANTLVRLLRKEGGKLMLQGSSLQFTARVLSLHSQQSMLLEATVELPTSVLQEQFLLEAIVLHLIKLTIFGCFQGIAFQTLVSILRRYSISAGGSIEYSPPLSVFEYGPIYQHPTPPAKPDKIAISECPMENFPDATIPTSNSQNPRQSARCLQHNNRSGRLVTLTLSREKRRVENPPIWDRETEGNSSHPRSLSFIDQLSGKRTHIYMSINSQRKSAAGAWKIKLTTFDPSNRYRQLTLNSQDYCQLVDNPIFDCEFAQVAADIASRLRILRDSAFSRLCLADCLDSDVYINIPHKYPVSYSQHFTYARFLHPHRQVRFFLVSKTVRWKTGYAIVMLYRIQYLAEAWLDVQVHFNDGTVWAGLSQSQPTLPTSTLSLLRLEDGQNGFYALLDNKRVQLYKRLLLIGDFSPDQDIVQLEEVVEIKHHGQPYFEIRTVGFGRSDDYCSLVSEQQVLALYRLEQAQNSPKYQKITQRELARYLLKIRSQQLSR